MVTPLDIIDAEWEHLCSLPRKEVIEYLVQLEIPKHEAELAVKATECYQK